MKHDISQNDCTFRPRISKQSKRLVSSKRSKSGSSNNQESSPSNDIHTRLYKESLQHKKQMERFKKKYISKSFKEKSDFSSSSKIFSCHSIKNNDNHNYMKAIGKCRKSCESNKSVRSKSRPKSKSHSRSTGRSVHESLYNDSKIRKAKNEYGYAKYYKERKKKFSKYLTKGGLDFGKRRKSRSKQIMEKVKYQRLKELFEKLDDDQDGYISAEKIDILEVSNRIIDIITPFLLEIESKALILNFEQF